jgi:DNA-binding transcriptional MerR regulator
MLNAGAFARLAGVSVRTLHHYDEVGLLKPAAVDTRTGYRRYTAHELPRLHRILALRDLGLSLGEIQGIIDDEISLDELRARLRSLQAEATERMAAEAQRIARVEARLRQLEVGNDPGRYDIVVKRLEPQRLAVLRDATDAFGNETLGPIFGRLFPNLYACLDHEGLRPAGPAVALYFDRPDLDAPIEVVAGVPIDAPDPSTHEIEILDLPDVPRAASTIHRGSMSRVVAGYEALLRWAEATGARVDGYGREVYLDCDGEPETWITELQFVLAPLQ